MEESPATDRAIEKMEAVTHILGHRMDGGACERTAMNSPESYWCR